MKLTKYTYGAAAALLMAMGTTACSESEIVSAEPEGGEGEVEYVISTALPETIQTYGAGDAGTDMSQEVDLSSYNSVNSALGGLANLVDRDYSVRYIMEIYQPSSGRLVRQIKYKPLASGSDYKNITFDPVRIKRSNRTEFIFWADIVKEVNALPYESDIPGEEMGLTCDMTGITLPYYANPYFYSNKDNKNDGTDPLYQTAMFWTRPGDLHHIAGMGYYVPGEDENQYNKEMYDGYCAYKELDASQMQGGPMNVTLTRPLAKLRFVTTDQDILAGNVDEDFNWGATAIELNKDETSKDPAEWTLLPSYDMGSGEAELFPGFNFLSPIWQQIVSIPDKGQGVPVYSEDTDKSRTIAVVYLPGQPKAVNLNAYIGNCGTHRDNFVIRLNLPNVPLVANKLTTIKGNFLSKDHNFSITVSDDFDTPGEDVVYTGTPASGD